jgi:hypothetical protein
MSDAQRDRHSALNLSSPPESPRRRLRGAQFLREPTAFADRCETRSTGGRETVDERVEETGPDRF